MIILHHAKFVPPSPSTLNILLSAVMFVVGFIVAAYAYEFLLGISLWDGFKLNVVAVSAGFGLLCGVVFMRMFDGYEKAKEYRRFAVTVLAILDAGSERGYGEHLHVIGNLKFRAESIRNLLLTYHPHIGIASFWDQQVKILDLMEEKVSAEKEAET